MRKGRIERLGQRWPVLGMGIVLIVAAFYLGGAARCAGLGFPLDDGWIHQTYARNLAQSGRLAYGAGEVSVGSTSPLWTLLLGGGYLLGLAPFPWTYILGVASWVLLGRAGAALAGRLFPRQPSVSLWVGLACMLEWHLAWAAFSGMETLLFSCLTLLLMERYAARAQPFLLGVIGGLSVLVRPEGILLVGLLVIWSLLDLVVSSPSGWRRRLIPVAANMAAGLAVLIVPYIALNEIVSGQLFPNTFYAKQAEYAALLAEPIWVRLWIVVRRPLVGAQALLIPGFVWQAIRGWRVQAVTTRTGQAPAPFAAGLLPVCWWALYLILYALRLPVDYQYGRYVMPTIPVLLIYGIAGTAYWLRPHSSHLVVRVFGRTMAIAAACLLVAFLFVGGQAFVNDVCIINGEMVDVALWLDAHSAPDDLIAAHDIGAIGYFVRRPLLDLAGLVTPDVIPFIRDEGRLLDFVIQEEADYLVTFPSWYPQMVADPRLVLVYETACENTRQKGQDNMAVYRIRR